MKNLAHYRKAIVAVIAAAVVIATETFATGSTESVIQIITVLLSSGGVYGLYNDPKKDNKEARV